MGSGTDLAKRRQLGALRHFVLQDERPPNLGRVDLSEIDPLLRGLLFTDGTVTRALEAQLLTRISVEVLTEARISTSAPLTDHLAATGGAETLRRRVVIGAGALASPLIWAESHILPERLPPAFLGALRDAQDGIGGSLQRVQMESWRELLWFGLDIAPAWSDTRSHGGSKTITRLYRVITAGRPALLISESFAVIHSEDVYRLDCPA